MITGYGVVTCLDLAFEAVLLSFELWVCVTE